MSKKKIVKPGSKSPGSIDDYIDGFPADVQSRLRKIRKLVLEVVPEAVELISYRIPAFKLQGRVLIYFAAFKEHLGMYPAPYEVSQFENVLARYGAGKGTLRFPHDKALPLAVIKRVLVYRAQQARIKASSKRKQK